MSDPLDPAIDHWATVETPDGTRVVHITSKDPDVRERCDVCQQGMERFA